MGTAHFLNRRHIHLWWPQDTTMATVKVKYISQNSPTAKTYEVPAASTWTEFLAAREPGLNLAGFVLRVRKLDGERVTPEGDSLVFDGAVASLAAKKQEGANI